MQGCASNGPCNICLVVSGSLPHSHVVSPLKYFHLLRCSLMHATPVRNLLRHLHAVQALVCPFAKFSSSCVMSKVLPVLPFTAADDFCREVSRLYGTKEAFSLQAFLCWNLSVWSGLSLFPVSSD